MTIFLAGATEPIGLSIMEVALKQGLNVCGITIEKDYITPKGVDIRVIESYEDQNAIGSHIRDCSPDIIINCTSVVYFTSAIPRKTLNTERRLLSSILPTHLAMLAKQHSARLIQFTTCFLHDGKESCYPADAIPQRRTPFAERIIEIERQLRQTIPDRLTLLRHPFCIGNSLSGVVTLHERLFFGWSHGQTPVMANDVKRQITSANTLAKVVIEMANRNDTIGVFNWADREIMTPFEFCAQIRAHFKLNKEQAPIETVSSDTLPQNSPERAKNLVLDPEPLASMLKTKALSFTEELQDLRIPEQFKGWYHSMVK